MAPPDRGHGVEKGQFGIGIVRHVENRKVPDDERIHQREHADAEQEEHQGEGHSSRPCPVHVIGP